MNRNNRGARMRPSYYGSGVWVEPFYLNPVFLFTVALMGLLAFIAFV